MNLTLLKHCAEDLDVVNAARVSFAQSHEVMADGDDKLIEFLLRNKHGTPFEHGFFKFHVEAPIFVFREWHRHRIGHSYNEMSGRYVELPEVYYSPDKLRTQHGKPGAYTFEDFDSSSASAAERRDHGISIDIITNQQREAFAAYKRLLARGVAKEQARAVLPVGTYSQMIWSCNPRSLMHFCALRNAPNALAEIRALAVQAEACLESLMPVTHGAFLANDRVAP